MTTKEKSPFPPKLYVKWDAESEFFHAEDTRAAHADLNGIVKIGVYRLVEEGEVISKVGYRSTR